MNFIWNLCGVFTLLPILVSMMNNSEETEDMCITDSPEKLENKFKFEIKKLEEIIVQELRRKNDSPNLEVHEVDDDEDANDTQHSDDTNDADDGEGSDDGDDGNDSNESDGYDYEQELLDEMLQFSKETETSRFLQKVTEVKEMEACTRVWSSCYSNLYPNKVAYYAGKKYLLTNERENSIFRGQYYENIEMLECSFNVVETGGPSRKVTTGTFTVRFRLAVLESRKKFKDILNEFGELRVSSTPRNTNHYFQPLYVFDISDDESCTIKACALMKRPF